MWFDLHVIGPPCFCNGKLDVNNHAKLNTSLDFAAGAPQIKHRFQKKHKLLSKHDYAQVFAKPGKLHHACFTILYRENTRPFPRLGLAVAKKALRHAVARNRFKRQVRESFRLVMLANHPQSGYQDGHPDAKQAKLTAFKNAQLDIVVIAKPAAGQQSQQAIRHALEKQWHLLIARCN